MNFQSKGQLMTFRLFASMLGLALVMTLPAQAQQAQIAFGGLKADTTLPVEVKADQLSVSNADGSAMFSGNVVVAQGDMRLAAGEVRVAYAPDGKAIQTLFATGGVTITNASDAAEAQEAVYTIDTGTVVMTGNVLLTQGASTLASQKLTINLKTGTGVMEGGVQTTFVPAVKK
jgi:lipopolysaccharide export system protein LptA